MDLNLFGFAILMLKNFRILHLSLKESLDVVLLLLDIVLMSAGVCNHLDLEACSEASLQVFWSVTSEVGAIFDDADSRSNVFCFFNVLS